MCHISSTFLIHPTSYLFQKLWSKVTTTVEAVPANERDPVPESGFDDGGHVLVELGADHPATRVHQGLGQGAGPRTDLQHQIPLLDTGCGHDPPQLVVIMEEVLAESMLRTYAAGIKELPDLGEGLHEHGSRSQANAISRG